jgi:heat shock protein HslJ
MDRKPIWAGGLLAALLLAGCSFVVQPVEAPALKMEMPSQPMEIELPDGSLCQFAGTGATLAFDGKRLNYTCGSPEVGLLGDPLPLGGTEWQVEKATIGREGDAFVLESSEVIPFTAWQVTLADGNLCLHAGFGATLGFDGQRLNYTCDQTAAQGSGADEAGLLGELSPAGEGIWLATAALIARAESGFELQASAQVPVARISGVQPEPVAAETPAPEEEAVAGGEPMTATETVTGTETMTETEPLIPAEPMTSPIGVTWEWQQTQYGDGTLVVPSDPSRYTITLLPDGTVTAQIDCNQASGSYVLEGDSLTFGPMISTLMGCPEGSQADVFATDLASAANFVLSDGVLSIGLAPDAGVMTFTPASAQAVAAGETTATSATGTVTETVPADNPLANTSWQWQQTEYGDDTLVVAQDPTRYTLTFLPDGQLAAQVDCNRGMSSYTVDGSALTFGPIATTRMLCPEGSQDAVFLRDLAAVNSFVLDGNVLSLALKLDTGIMTFTQLE